MKTGTVLRKTLHDNRGTNIGIGLVIGGLALMVVLIYPSYRDSLADFEMPAVFEGFLGEASSIAAPEGFLSTEFFSWVPLLLITLAIIGGSASLAGEEGAGTMDLLLAQPVRRRRVVLEKAAGLTIAIVLAAAASLVGFLLGGLWVEIGVSFSRFTQAVINMVPLALLFLALSLWASAALPSRGAAAMPVTGFAVVAFVVQLIAQSVPSLHTIQKVSPFYWAEPSRVLIHGFEWLRAGAMMAIAGVCLLLAVRSFERRDIATGAREWHLPRLPRWPRRREPHEELAETPPALGNPGSHGVASH